LKVISLIEPWATLIKEKKKYIETRSWNTDYRGELYIHASTKKINTKDPEIKELLELIPDVEMNYGHIICKCNIVDSKCMDKEFLEDISKNEQEHLCGIYDEGRYAWMLEDIEVLDEPIKARGHLRIWNYEEEALNKEELELND